MPDNKDRLQTANLLTVEDLRKVLKVHRTTIYGMLQRGELPGFKIANQWRFSLDAIDGWRCALQQSQAARAADSTAKKRQRRKKSRK